MKKIILSLLLTAMCINASMACTNLLVGKEASTDGSIFVTYSADSYSLYGELYHWPAATYPAGTMLDVNEWDTGKFLGQIAQVSQTYNVIGNMNEHQLCIAETTWGGREELHDPNGIMDYGSLIYITLQRAKTAREAIDVMTGLVEQYGYYSSGESFSIADKDELWVLEMIGKGPEKKGAVWVAMRIPDDCISAHANQARIHKFPLKDPANCLYSKDVISFAKEKGYYKGSDKDFSFSKTYNPLDWGGLRACEARVWSFYNQISDDAKQWIPYILGQDPEPMPLYLKPNRKLSVKDMMDMMRDHYEGTPFDPTLDAGAGPFGSPYRFNPLTFTYEGKKYMFERPISTQQTGFTFVGQMRSWLPDEVGGVLWFGVDDAKFTVYNPMYTSMTETPECYRVGNGDYTTFSWTSAFWIHNWVAQLAYSRYNQMIQDTMPLQDKLENSYIRAQGAIEAKAVELLKISPKEAVAFLTSYSVAAAQHSTEQWKELGTYLVVKYLDGVVKKEKDGEFIQNEFGGSEYPNRPQFRDEFLKEIVEDNGSWIEQKEIKL
ncbi:C69 family dipeptidase [Bacteroidales bacterium OttesenSCG-928-I14]|nr:C69 family dipeptidase [Bacteroidales bacterium OttesenSCG-928-I14]